MPTTELDGLRSIGVAVLAVAVAAVLRYAIGLLEPTALYFAMFYPAVLLATLVGGLRAGIVATVLSLLVVWYVFLPPRIHIRLQGTCDRN
jgi:K+-sensing histidine kinase KdpD